MNWGFDRLGWIKRLEFPAVAALAVAILCVLIGQAAERYASGASTSLIALFDPSAAETKAESRASPIFNTIDYATTGSIKGRSIVISPCAAQQSER
jgi:hypothetical protein